MAHTGRHRTSPSTRTLKVTARVQRPARDNMGAMCGIAGAIGLEHDQAQQAVAAMCARMRPRGPDDGGIESFQSPNGSAIIGSRRLAIIDLSRAGHQPMHDLGRGTAIVFNGMIYNFKSLREQLRHEGEEFGSECDTEVVLRAYGRYGRDCVPPSSIRESCRRCGRHFSPVTLVGTALGPCTRCADGPTASPPPRRSD
jgi:glutamine phosphoribosylpyrophosphate amidotransferase